MVQVESLRATCLNMLLLRGFPCRLPQWIPPVSHITVPRGLSAGPQINISDCIQLSKNRCKITKRLNLTKFHRSESWNVDILEPTRWFWKAMWIIPLYLLRSRCTINWHHVLAIWQTLRILSCFALPPIYPLTVLKKKMTIKYLWLLHFQYLLNRTCLDMSPLCLQYIHIYSPQHFIYQIASVQMLMCILPHIIVLYFSILYKIVPRVLAIPLQPQFTCHRSGQRWAETTPQ